MCGGKSTVVALTLYSSRRMVLQIAFPIYLRNPEAIHASVPRSPSSVELPVAGCFYTYSTNGVCPNKGACQEERIFNHNDGCSRSSGDGKMGRRSGSRDGGNSVSATWRETSACS